MKWVTCDGAFFRWHFLKVENVKVVCIYQYQPKCTKTAELKFGSRWSKRVIRTCLRSGMKFFGRSGRNGMVLIIMIKTTCWCNHNNNGNNTRRIWIILLNIISIKKGITQHNLDWGAALALFKDIQALGWLNFVTGVDILWLISPRIQQPKNVEWLEQPLHKMFKPKTSLERTPFYAKNLSIF